MNTCRLLTAAIVTCLLVTGANADDKKKTDDKAKLLVGKWEATKGDKELPVGSVIEFEKEGKMRMTMKVDGKQQSVEATYSVEGNKIQLTLKLDKREEKKRPTTIKTISEKQLVLEGDKDMIWELKRVK